MLSQSNQYSDIISGYLFMNIYLCSTVRHLLFSLLKSLPESDDKSLIFMITDQQNIDQHNFDGEVLPAHVEVIFIAREKLNVQIYSGLKGGIIKKMATLNVKTSASIRKKIRTLLFNQTLGLPFFNNIEQGQLFLFNDRNKMSRLFRLAFEKYTLVEEGLANYNGIKLSPFKQFCKFITASPDTMRYFGDDKRCSNIFLVNDKKAPEILRHKVKAITFLQNKAAIESCKAFFKMQIGNSPQCILATQPLERTGIDLSIYKKLNFT